LAGSGWQRGSGSGCQDEGMRLRMTMYKITQDHKRTQRYFIKILFSKISY